MVLLAIILGLTTVFTIPSLHCIKNQIDVSLVTEGQLKNVSEDIEILSAPSYDYTQLARKDYNSEEEESLLLWRIIKRNELSISEAGVESTYQFMTQWAIYFTINYWLSLAGVAKKLTEEQTVNTSMDDRFGCECLEH